MALAFKRVKSVQLILMLEKNIPSVAFYNLPVKLFHPDLLGGDVTVRNVCSCISATRQDG